MNAQFLDDAILAAFQEYIYQLTGIHYTDAKRYLLDGRVKKRTAEVGLKDGASYLDYLRHSPDSEKEVEQLIDQVSIHETSFFRHQKQIDIVRELLTDLISVRRRSGSKSLKIWSAACSSGEEPFTLAMVMRELLDGEVSQWDIAVVGTDISTGVIAQARAGRYGKRSIQMVAEPYMSKYIRADFQNPQQYILVPEILRMVSFRPLSLLDQFRVDAMRDQDFILCRNVLIYFDAEAKKKVLASLWNALRPGGYLVLGPSESLHGLTKDFQRTPHSVYNFYQRPEVGPAAANTPAPSVTSIPSAMATPPPSVPAHADGSLPPATSLRVKTSIMRLDRGLNDLQRDFDSSLGKTIDGIGEISAALQELAGLGGIDRQVQSGLGRIDRQLARILIFLQVGDRGHQKMEALRSVVQELSDRLMGKEKEAPDLQVRTTTFDASILEQRKDEEGKQEDEQGSETLSQEDIDALFN